MEDIRREIECVNDQFLDYYHNQQFADLIQLHTEDCQLIPHNSENVVGHKDCEAFLRELAKTHVTLKHEIVECLGGMGEYAVHTCNTTTQDAQGNVSGNFKESASFYKESLENMKYMHGDVEENRWVVENL